MSFTFTCDVCGCNLKTEPALKNHIEIRHVGWDGWKCAVCWRMFVNHKRLEGHYARVHPEFQREWAKDIEEKNGEV